MGIFDRFPYSSTHEMNLDFMLGKATEIAEDMQTVATGMAQVQAGLSAISEKTEQATQAAAQAAQSASSIEGSVTAAEEAAEEAQMHNESAQTWANNALTYKADCQRSATEAAASSASAAQAATAAAGSEDTVAQYAQAANASAQSAANNNDSAHQYANQASASASNATFHSSNAQTAATNAQTAATNAQTAADRAASLKTDVETLHRMCTAAVDQAATEAVNAANSAAQAAATKTDVENLVESLPEDFTDLNNTVNQLSDEIDNLHEIIYPNENTVFSEFSDSALSATNQYKSIGILAKDHTYRIVLSFSAEPTNLSAIRTSKAQSGSGNVDTLTELFTGGSWTAGKTLLYTPAVAGIQYMQFQFNSAYTGDLTASLTIYDYEKEQKTAINELSATIAENSAGIKKQEYVINLDKAYNLLPPTGYETNKLITSTGAVADSPGKCLSDYIPLDENQSYICNFTKTASVVNGDPALTGNLNTFERFNFCFFDADKNPITFTEDAAAISKAIPQGAKYIRVTCSSEQLYKLAVLIYGNYTTQPIVRIIDYKKTQQHAYDSPNTGMEKLNMVMFGDSITHGSLSVSNNGTSYVDYANDYLHSNIINVGFGGTRMTYPTLSGNYLFQFRNLVDCIVSDDASAWDALDAYASGTDFEPHLNTLKAIDWSKMHAIGLMYGANDFTSNTPVGTAYNENVSNFDGACASALKKLLTKYPHLQVILFGPFDRMMDTNDPTTMTDTTPNNIGLYMKDYANSLENVVSKFHCPLIKTGELLGINAQTILTYAPDGTHPRANIGQKRLGWLFAQAIKNCIAPFNTFD